MPDDQLPHPEGEATVPDPSATPEHGGAGGKLERLADSVAAGFTEQSRPAATPARQEQASTPPVPEGSGAAPRSADLGDGEVHLHPGDELSVRIPGGDGEVSYALEGDAEALEVSQRAELVDATGEHSSALGAAAGALTLRARRSGGVVLTVTRGGAALGRLAVSVD